MSETEGKYSVELFKEGGSGPPSDLIANPLGGDEDDKHDERSEGDPKIGKKVFAVSIKI